jgi:hypothetical protein
MVSCPLRNSKLLMGQFVIHNPHLVQSMLILTEVKAFSAVTGKKHLGAKDDDFLLL